MVDIEMDIDVAPPLDAHNQADEDLIDYDDDTLEVEDADAQSHAPIEVSNAKHQSSLGLDASGAQELGSSFPQSDLTMETFDPDGDENIHQQAESIDPQSFTKGETSPMMDQVNGTDTDAVISNNLHLDDGEIEEEHDYEMGIDGEAYGPDVNDPILEDDSMHEIDYDRQDDHPLGPEEIHDEAVADSEDVEVPQEAEVDEVPSFDGDLQAADQNTAAVAATQGERTETNGEDTQVDVEDGQAPNHGPEDDSSTMPQANEGEEQEEEQGAEEAAEEGGGGGDNEDGDVAWHGNGQDGGETLEEDDGDDKNAVENEGEERGGEASTKSSERHDDFVPDGDGYPRVTVQYKGDEYPMFSTSDGFFSELSTLDSSMEVLMAGFRAELADELSVDDELVFQVDELGLEIAESHAPDSLSAITLRQILVIFDLLVKNEEPDTSRALYTYLFTKPSTSKRFEFLVEKATAGRGLAEVSRLFGSSMDHGHAVVDADDADGTIEGDEERLNTPETAAGNATDNRDDGTDHINGHVEGEHSDTDNAPQGISTGVSATAEADELVGGHPSGDTSNEVTNPVKQVEPGEAEIIEPSIDAELYAAAETETRPFQSLDFAESAEVKDIDLEPEIVSNTDGDDIALPSINDSSTTNTIQGDAEPKSVLSKESPDPELTHEPTDQLSAPGDALDEIDWRDELETEVTAEEPSSGVAKRAHTDTELGTEDEKDVKRRRS